MKAWRRSGRRGRRGSRGASAAPVPYPPDRPVPPLRRSFRSVRGRVPRHQTKVPRNGARRHPDACGRCHAGSRRGYGAGEHFRLPKRRLRAAAFSADRRAASSGPIGPSRTSARYGPACGRIGAGTPEGHSVRRVRGAFEAEGASSAGPGRGPRGVRQARASGIGNSVRDIPFRAPPIRPGSAAITGFNGKCAASGEARVLSGRTLRRAVGCGGRPVMASPPSVTKAVPYIKKEVGSPPANTGGELGRIAGTGAAAPFTVPPAGPSSGGLSSPIHFRPAAERLLSDRAHRVAP